MPDSVLYYSYNVEVEGVKMKRNNNMIKHKILIAATLVLSLSACNATTAGNKGLIGTLVGAGGGAFMGSKIGSGRGNLAAVAIGTLGGAFLGNRLGSSLDELDKMKIQQTSQYSLERSRDGQAGSWNNPNNGNSGTITPTRTVKENGTFCREYQQTVTIDGKTQKAYGKACRQIDGSWNIKS